MRGYDASTVAMLVVSFTVVLTAGCTTATLEAPHSGWIEARAVDGASSPKLHGA